MEKLHEPQRWRFSWDDSKDLWRVQHEPPYEGEVKLPIYYYKEAAFRGVDAVSVQRGKSGHLLLYGTLTENGMGVTIRGEPGKL